ncbi:MAG: orotidine-5'-phosphate decarboxylase [Verrucomicrobiota bacterium]|nr:orotidine-5'-phosphate decarboxylase [Verrucomicrobiota bacterium]
MKRNPIIVALDVQESSRALELARALAGTVGALKIGSELFTIAGPEIVRQVRALGVPVFLDLKFHDIPNTVAQAVSSAVQLDVSMLTIHAGGGSAMMKAALEAARTSAAKFNRPEPLLLGVTVLTSLSDAELGEVGLEPNAVEQVARLARLAVQSGMNGLVCSPKEVPVLRGFLPPTFQLVTPGIRPAGSAMGDQKRTLTPREALEAGSNWLVIGRPICAAADPRRVAEEIVQTL